ncbi:MAG: TolC family protein [Oceanipulchritudo sp.]
MSLNPDSRRPVILFRTGWILLLVLLTTGTVSAEPVIRFAEEIFPELRGLMETAVQKGGEFRLNALQVEERQGELDVAKGQRRPSVDLHARVLGAYEIREDIDNDTSADLYGRFTMTQPLYHWGRLERRQSIAENRVALEEGEYRQKGTRHFMDLRRAYLEWLLMREHRTILEQSIRLSGSYVEARTQLVQAGRASEQDLLEMEAWLMENREGLARISKRVRELELRIEQLVGSPVDFSLLGERSLALIEPMAEEQLLQWMDRENRAPEDLWNPHAEYFSMQKTIQDEQLEILDKNHWPTLDFVSGVFTDQLDSINQQDSVLRVRFYAGLQVNWNIFDGWQTDGYKRTTLARKRAFALREERARDESRQRFRSLLADLQLNLKQIEAREKREQILARRVELLRQQAQRDQATDTDLIGGEIDYLEVRQRLMEARVHYLVNLMELGILLGKDPAETYFRSES